jgi:uncharacterized protein (UPF0332 family)
VKRPKEELIRYRIERAGECMEEARILAETNHWNAVASRLYCGCFYLAGALIIQHDVPVSSHADVKDIFIRDFTGAGHFNKKLGELYMILYEKQQNDECEDLIIYSRQEIEPLIEQSELFVKTLVFQLTCQNSR